MLQHGIRQPRIDTKEKAAKCNFVGVDQLVDCAVPDVVAFFLVK